MAKDTWLYSDEHPTGKLFLELEAKDEAAMLADGWFDTPAKLGATDAFDLDAEIAWMRTKPSQGKDRMIALAEIVGADTGGSPNMADLIVRIEAALAAPRE